MASFNRSRLGSLVRSKQASRDVKNYSSIGKISKVASKPRGVSSYRSAPAPATSANTKSFSVQRGNTLSGLAKQWGTSVDAIMRSNPNIKNPNMIKVGQNITNPTYRPPPSPKPKPVAASTLARQKVAAIAKQKSATIKRQPTPRPVSSRAPRPTRVRPVSKPKPPTSRAPKPGATPRRSGPVGLRNVPTPDTGSSALGPRNPKTLAALRQIAQNASNAAMLRGRTRLGSPSSYAARPKVGGRISTGTSGGRTGGENTRGVVRPGTVTPTPTPTPTPTSPTSPSRPAPTQPAPIINPGVRTPNAGTFTNTGGPGTYGRFLRQRRNRGPRTGLSLTPEMLRRLAQRRIGI